MWVGLPVEAVAPLLETMFKEKLIEGRAYALGDWLAMEWRHWPG